MKNPFLSVIYSFMTVTREDIETLYQNIMRLKREYEQYFSRILDREPLELRREVERAILRYTSTPINNTALKFRLNTVVATFNSYRQYWNRMLRAMEEGRLRRSPETGAFVSVERPVQGETPAPDDPLKKVYEEYINLKKQHQGASAEISFERFKKTIEEQKRKLQESRGIKDVEPRTVVKDGKVRIAFVAKKKSS